MGQNLIMNMADHGFVVCAYNRTTSKVDEFLANEAKGKSIVGAHSLQDLINKLKKPRRVMMLVKGNCYSCISFLFESRTIPHKLVIYFWIWSIWGYLDINGDTDKVKHIKYILLLKFHMLLFFLTMKIIYANSSVVEMRDNGLNHSNFMLSNKTILECVKILCMHSKAIRMQ